MSFESFHFLRPAWLLALLLLVPAAWLWLRPGRAASAWRRLCDPQLLRHLMLDGRSAGSRLVLAGVVAGWTAACLALAGPTWERLPVPAYHEPVQTMLVLSLAPSMTGADVEPSRLVRARYKLQDVLARVEGAVGLVIFAEESYAVTPLTDDPRVIAEQVPLLEPSLMPGRSARLDRAIAEAERLLDAAGAVQGRVLVLSDGLGDAPDAALEAARRSAAAGYPVSALGFGRAAAALESLADAGQGRFETLQADDADLESLLVDVPPSPALGGALAEAGVTADAWRDRGVWLLWIPLLLAPLAFRRGWATAAGVVACLFVGLARPPAAEAAAADWWSRPDQQGEQAFARGAYDAAGELFEDPDWRAASAYRAGDYASAAEAWQQQSDPQSQYNLGNSLARGGRLEDALAAYDRALAADPDHEDARFNRDLVAKLLEEQQQQQEQQSQDSQGQGSQDQDAQSQDSQGQGSQGQGSQDPDAQDPDAQDPDAQDPDAQDPDAQDPDAQDPDAQGRDSQGQQSSQPSQGQDSGDPSQRSDADSAAQDPGDPEPQTPEDASARSANTPPRDARDQPRHSNAAAGDATAGEERDDPATAAGPGSARTFSERDQEAEQWLNRVPDDPGALLREKLRRRYEERRYGQRPVRGARR